MSRILFDFLTESFLFNEAGSGYSGISNEALSQELNRYRQHVLRNLNDMISDVRAHGSRISAQLPSLSAKNESLLRQLVLYMDQVVVDDPLFKMTYRPGNFAKGLSKHLGFANDYDRRAIAGAATSMMTLRSAVASEYVRFFPISLFTEPTDPIPLLYSESGFADAIKDELLDFFYERVRVTSLSKSADGGWLIDDQLVPCRAITVGFENHSEDWSHVYYYYEMDSVEMDDPSRTFSGRLQLPETPPDPASFEQWVMQSIHQSSLGILDSLTKEMQLSARLNSMALTASPFLYQLANKLLVPMDKVRTDLATMAMSLDLPIMQRVTLEDLVAIRDNDGEAFERFRIELDRRLLSLRSLSDPEELRIQLENLSFELANVQVREITEKLRALTKVSFSDALVVAASVLTAIPTHGASLLSLALPVVSPLQKKLKEWDAVRQHPGFFLWHLSNKVM